MLRQWQDQDYPIFAELNADPEVMHYFPACLSREESDEIANTCRKFITERGWSFWAVELKDIREFIGFVGLHKPKANLPFSPCVEVGWRLHKKFWNQGYATEGAKASLQYAFETLKLDEVVSFTAIANQRSRAVMERLGMEDSNQNFMHPDLPGNHPLAEHILYKISKSRFRLMKR